MRERSLALLAPLLLALGAAGGCHHGRVVPITSADRVEYGVVDRLGGEALHVAEVVERRRGLAAVRYRDTALEWVEADRVQPLSSLVGQRVRIAWAEPAPSESVNEVTEVRDDLVRIVVGEDGHTWVPAALLGDVATAAEDDAGEDGQAAVALGDPEHVLSPIATPAIPRPAPADDARIQPDAFVEVFQEGGRYPAQVLERGGDQARIRWLPDGNEVWVARSSVVRVFSPIADRELVAGMRVWFVGPSGLAVGTVAERRREFVRIVPAASSGVGLWLERPHVVEAVRPLEADALEAGMRVGVLWGAGVWDATVLEAEGEVVTIRWHDGDQVQQVSRTEVVAAP